MIPSAIISFGENAVECQVLSAQIHHGRDDATTQPVASTAVVELVGPLPDINIIGQRVVIKAVLANMQVPRFVGEVTDIRMGWESADLARPQIVAVGDIGRLGRRVVGDAPWPSESDGERVARILTLAGFPPDPLLTDPGTVEVLARDVDKQPALDLSHETASDGGGMLWQDVVGRIMYADANHRRSARLAYTFDACNVGVDLGWQKSLEGLVNDLYLRYGPIPEGGEQSEIHAMHSVSIAERGTFGASLTTQIASLSDAEKRATEIIAKQSVPAWVLGGLEVELSFLSESDWYSLLAVVNIHDLVAITGLPPEGPSTDTLLWVEGWRENIGAESWTIAYATSDYCRTAAPAHWDDVAQDVTWDTIGTDLVWDQAVCFPPLASGGSWDETSATDRWDTLYPSLTWDNWGTGP